jgi:hypothetical protein
VQVRCGARTDQEQCQSSAPCDLRERHRQDETRRTVDLGHSSDAPIMDRPRRESRHHNGITLRGVSQSTFATKSALFGHVPIFKLSLISGVKRSMRSAGVAETLLSQCPSQARSVTKCVRQRIRDYSRSSRNSPKVHYAEGYRCSKFYQSWLKSR